MYQITSLRADLLRLEAESRQAAAIALEKQARLRSLGERVAVAHNLVVTPLYWQQDLAGTVYREFNVSAEMKEPVYFFICGLLYISLS